MRHLYERCPLCRSSAFSPFASGDATIHSLYKEPLPKVVNWVKCADCCHVFTDGHWTAEALEVLSTSVHAYQGGGDFGQIESWEIWRSVSARIIDKVTALRGGKTGIWLDVGFGNGSLLLTAAEFGYDPIGLELRSDTVTKLKKIGIVLEAYQAPLEEFSADKEAAFDVISFADVLEHIAFPSVTLRAARFAIKDDGILFVSCPNSDSAIWKLMRDENPYWVEIEHYHNFSRDRLTSLLEDCGFKVIHYGISDRYRSCMELTCKVVS